MKKLLVLCVFFVVGFFLHPLSSYAQESLEPMRINPEVSRDHRTYTQSTVVELLVSASCILTGVDPVNPQSPCLGVDPVSRKLGYVENQEGGLIGMMSGAIGGMYNIPISTHDYVAYNASRFGVVDSAYAQDGVGFDALHPIINVWIAFRNVVFVFFVILFILIGLGIMFRLQIDQRAVMSIQNQLPKIVIVIILVVLSYGIAGFMIDLMYVLMYFIYELFANIDGVRLDPSILQSRTPLDAVGGFSGGLGIANDAAQPIGDIVSSIFDGTAGRIVAGILGGLIGALVGGGLFGGIIGSVSGFVFGDEILGTLGTVIAWVIFSAALAIALFRLWFTLLKSFVSILIGAVLAPVWIAASLIPASPFPISSWFRFMAGNLLMFPAALAMFLFAFAFMQLFGAGGDIIVFPFVYNPNDINAFGALIAFAIILLIPNVVTKVKDAVGVPAGEITSAVVGTVGGGANLAGRTVGTFAKPFWGADRQGRRPLTTWVEERLKRRGWLGRTIASGLPGRNREDEHTGR